MPGEIGRDGAPHERLTGGILDKFNAMHEFTLATIGGVQDEGVGRILIFQRYFMRSGLTLSEMAKRIEKWAGTPVPPQSVHRWSRPLDHKNFSIPEPEVIAAISLATGGRVTANDWHRHLTSALRRRRRRHVIERVANPVEIRA